MRWCAPLFLVVLSAPARAQFYSWHSVEAGFRLSEKWQIVLNERTRTRDNFTFLDQQRVGGVVRWSASRRVGLFGGYFYQPQQLWEEHWVHGQRLFGGAEVPFRLGRQVALTNRLAAERFIGAGRPDYSRCRTYTRAVFGVRRVAPFVQSELLVVKQGVHSLRTSGGMRFRVYPGISMEAGYVYDCRRTVWGGDRHALTTSVRFDSGGKR